MIALRVVAIYRGVHLPHDCPPNAFALPAMDATTTTFADNCEKAFRASAVLDTFAIAEPLDIMYVILIK